MNDQVLIRNFSYDDINFIYNNWAENPKWKGCKFKKNVNSIRELIDLFNKKSYNSRYFEQYVILTKNIPIGMVSLYEKNNFEISVGIYIDYNYRRIGVGTNVYKLIINEAINKNYKILSANVLQENVASINFHLKMGFKHDSIYLNTRGKKQIKFIKQLIKKENNL